MVVVVVVHTLQYLLAYWDYYSAYVNAFTAGRRFFARISTILFVDFAICIRWLCTLNQSECKLETIAWCERTQSANAPKPLLRTALGFR